LLIGMEKEPVERVAVVLFHAGPQILCAAEAEEAFDTGRAEIELAAARAPEVEHDLIRCRLPLDRKSTRLNSSHVAISYAVFCLNAYAHRHLHSFPTRRSSDLC